MPTVVLVHHANQLLITDGYTHRDGIGPVAGAVLDVAAVHEAHGLPASLHLSGTLVEALAWHRPDVLDATRQRAASGLLEVMGGAYAEPVLTELSDRAVRRHLRVTAQVSARHLGTDGPGGLASAWVPERVWHPRMGPLLAEAGYRRVALDDRLLLPAAERPAYDARGPWAQRPERLDPALCRVVREDSAGLLVAPISAALRYLVPPRDDDDLALLDRLVDALPDDAVLVYADDLERTAGVAGWEPALDRFARFAAWLEGHPRLRAARLADLPAPPAAATPVHLAPGTYYELAHLHGAGDDYRGWGADLRWQPYATAVQRVERQLDAGERGRDVDALAERLLLVAQHETGWQDVTDAPGRDAAEHVGPPGRAPAPWARATAAHVRDARPLMHVGRWAAAGGCAPTAVELDTEGDGEPEIVLADRSLWCLLSPRYGGRVTLLGVRDGDDARVVVGNPLDHWNFQEESHRYMQEPPGHPGAFGAHGQQDEAWQVLPPEAGPDLARVVLTRPDGQTRRIGLYDGRLALCWQGPGTTRVTVESLVSADYLRDLREGSRGTTGTGGRQWAGMTAGGRTTWTAWDAGAVCVPPTARLAGHGGAFAVSGAGHLDVLVGVGPVDEAALPGHLAQAHAALHEPLLVPLR